YDLLEVNILHFHIVRSEMVEYNFDRLYLEDTLMMEFRIYFRQHEDHAWQNPRFMTSKSTS
ncbi:unnamed protein product, partial [Sphenostylis stenocarpa]